MRYLVSQFLLVRHPDAEDVRLPQPAEQAVALPQSLVLGCGPVAEEG
jgi:hypothetical protein